MSGKSLETWTSVLTKPYIVEKEGKRFVIIENNGIDQRIEMLADEFFSKLEKFIRSQIKGYQA